MNLKTKEKAWSLQWSLFPKTDPTFAIIFISFQKCQTTLTSKQTWRTTLIQQFENQFHTKVKSVRSDNSSELRFTQYYKEKGITSFHSCPETPEQNSVVEITHQNVLELICFNLVFLCHLERLCFNWYLSYQQDSITASIQQISISNA